MFSNISFIWRIYLGTCLRVIVILCCNADWVLAVSTNSLRDYSFHIHDTPNTPYRSNNSTRVSYCWMFWTKGSIVAIRIPIYLHQSYARQWRSLYAHLWRHKQIILAVSTNMLICYHSAFGKPIHQLHLMLAIEFHSSTMFWSINSGSSFLILLPFLFLLPNIPFIVSRLPYLFHFAVN